MTNKLSIKQKIKINITDFSFYHRFQHSLARGNSLTTTIHFIIKQISSLEPEKSKIKRETKD